MARRSRWARVCAVATAAVTAAATLTLAAMPTAHAGDTWPTPPPMADSSSSTVTADALPTVQLDDGVVWSQVMIGNIVYVAGNFSNARPYGAAKGTNLIPRGNLLAYNITTGDLVSGWAPQTNGQVRTITRSPDGSRIYIGGDFTQVNGTKRLLAAALDPTTGALISSFKPVVGGAFVASIAATNSTVYLGGNFTAANGVARGNLAAYSAAGALLNWTPSADLEVDAMVIAPDNSRVIIGGRFGTVNGQTQRGLAALDPSTGAIDPWAATDQIKEGLSTGPTAGKAGIYSLSTDGTSVFGTGWVFSDAATGNLEGAFSAQPDSGTINWIEACHGDTYGAYSDGTQVYTVSHAHYCGDMGGYPQSDSDWGINMRHAVAWTTQRTGTIAHDAYAGATYHDWYGSPGPSMINWFPDFLTGKFTGSGQAAWSITGGNGYISLGGEFPGVNGAPQYGLVRFATRAHSTPKQAPRLSGSSWPVSVSTNAPGIARASFQANWDRDNMKLTYKLIRDNNTANPVAQRTVTSTFWDRPTVGLNDTTASAGSHSYKVVVSDPDGNTVASTPVTATVTAGAPSAYTLKVLNSDPSLYWRLDDAPGSTTAIDLAGSDNGTVNSGVTLGQSGALVNDKDTAAAFGGSQSGYVAGTTQLAGRNTFTISSWFNTTTQNGGKIIGFGNQASGNSSNYDRHIYMDPSGRLNFGVYPGSAQIIQSPNAYNDGKWHQVAASLGPDGMALYVDGRLVGSRSDITTAQTYNGYWRVGGDSSWAGSNYFAGSMDEATVWDTAIDAATVKDLYRTGIGVVGNQPPTAAFTPTSHFLGLGVDASASSDVDGSIAAYSWSWGDGSAAGSGITANHTYAAAGSYDVKLTVTDDEGATSIVTHTVTVTAPQTDSNYAAAVLNSGAGLYWRLADAPGSSTAKDAAGSDDGQVNSGVTFGQNGALTDDSDTSASFSGDGSGYLVGSTQLNGPNTFSVSAWFKTDTTSGGKIVGFGDQQNGNSGSYDRHIYMDNAGHLTFGTYTGNTETVVTPNTYNDNQWHSVVATLGSNGMRLYVDGALVGQSDNTAAQPYAGYWRVGGDNLNGWPNRPNSSYFAGSIDDVAVWDWAIDSSTVGTLYNAGSQAPNQKPTAAFTLSVNSVSASVDGSGSSDPDGTIASYSWDWGDNTAAGSGKTATHDYAAGGTYTITLTVTDDQGATDTVKHTVTVTVPNQPPTAAFTSSVNDLTASVDGSSSSDSDGTVASYAWDWGDNTAAGSGKTASHDYAAAGTYTITLTVTDDGGATDTVKHDVTVSAANQKPTAAYTSSVNNLTASVDGTGSADPDGSISSYAWDWGDGSAAGSGQTATHTYASAGTYTVKLTVTDNDGATNSTSQQVSVSANAGNAIAADQFSRTTSSGWGNADVGGPWTVSGSTSRYSVGSGVGQMQLTQAGQSDVAQLPGVSSRDVNYTASVSLSQVPNGGGAYVSYSARKTSAGVELLTLQFKSNGSVVMKLSRLVGSTETTLASGTVPKVTSSDTVAMRFQVTGTGTTSISGKAWNANNAEPSNWLLTASDTDSNVQKAGNIAVRAYLSGSTTTVPLTASFDNLQVIPAGAGA